METQAADSACVRRVLGGERNAYGEIVHRYEKRLFSLVLMMTRDRGGAEEVTQDAFLRAHSNLRRYDQERPLYPWLAMIAVRLASNWQRTAARHRRGDPDVDTEALPAHNDTSPIVELARHQAEHAIWCHVATLPKGERSAVLMFYKQDLTVSEIAGILGVTNGTIKTFLHRGRMHLRTRLETTGGTP